jgi:AcrR family transcriptional regulator
MSKSAWSGNPPKDESEARARLCEATLSCIVRVGLPKTSMSDIAKEAGVTRPTLYKYFNSKASAFIAAIDAVALEFAHSVAKHVSRFDTIEERIIEMILFVVKKLPRHKYLSLVLNPECSVVLAERAFSDERPRELSRIVIAPVVELRPDLRPEGEEIAEVMSRFAISLILFPGRFKSSGEELREFIRRRLLPGLLGIC